MHAAAREGTEDTIMYKTMQPTEAPTFAPSTRPPTIAPTTEVTPRSNVVKTLASFTVDDYIVYSTVLFLAVVVVVCGGMWCARPAKRPKPQVVDRSGDLEAGQSGSKSRETIKKSKGTASAVSSSTAGGGKKKAKSAGKTKSPMHDEVFDDTREETGSLVSEASSLLGGEVLTAAAGGGRNSTLAVGGSGGLASTQTAARGASRAFKELSPQDEALRKTFHSVLKEGMTLLLHTGDKNPKQVHLTLVGTELRWKAAKVFARNLYKIDLRDIKYVEWGKQTSTFQKHPSMGASEDLCFSLITDKVTVDLEASSKVERDALVQGFSLVVGGLRMFSS